MAHEAHGALLHTGSMSSLLTRLLRLLAALTASVYALSACTCVPNEGGACRSAQSATDIFTGRVIGVKTDEHTKTFTFERLTAFRGSASTTIEVVTAASGAACGAGFELHEEYLVFASRVEGHYKTNLCAGNQRLGDAADDLAYLHQAGPALASSAPLPGYLFGYVSNQQPEFESNWHASWPLPGLRVTATGVRASAEARTGPEGSFRFFGLPPGGYRVTVESAGNFAPRKARNRQDSSPVDLTLGSCQAISFHRTDRALLIGRLRDGDGEPDDGSRLVLKPLDASPSVTPTQLAELVTQADDGKFQFLVPPGRYRLAIHEPGYEKTEQYPAELTLRSEAATHIDFQLPKHPRKTIEALVIDLDGQPVAEAIVNLTGLAPGINIAGTARSPVSGRIRFEELIVVEYRLEASLAACPTATSVSARIAAADPGLVKLILPTRRASCPAPPTKTSQQR